MTNSINLREQFNGRHVWIMNDKWLDYWPTGCALRTVRRDGRTTYAEKDNPHARVTPPRVID